MAGPTVTRAPPGLATSAPQPSSAPPVNGTEEQQQPSPIPLRQRLAASERRWIWKVSLRSIIIILNLIIIGSSVWLLATATNSPEQLYLDYGDNNWEYIYILIISAASLIWCVLWLAFLLDPLKPNRRRRSSNGKRDNNNKAPHPGVAVGLDLILWLAFLVAGFIALSSYYATSYFGSGGEIDDPTYSSHYSGYYYLSPQTGEWVYKVTYVSPYDNPPGTTVKNVKLDCKPAFATCAAQDAFVNALWRAKPTREAVELLLVILTWGLTVLHFVIFVWACVDTHRRRKGRDGRAARRLAEEMVRDLQARGLISVHAPGNAGGAGGGSVVGSGPGYVDVLRQQDAVLLQQMMQRPGGGVGEKGNVAGQGDDAILPVHEAAARYA